MHRDRSQRSRHRLTRTAVLLGASLLSWVVAVLFALAVAREDWPLAGAVAGFLLSLCAVTFVRGGRLHR